MLSLFCFYIYGLYLRSLLFCPCPSILLVFACYVPSTERAQQAQAQGVRGHRGLYWQNVTEKEATLPQGDVKWPQDIQNNHKMMLKISKMTPKRRKMITKLQNGHEMMQRDEK